MGLEVRTEQQAGGAVIVAPVGEFEVYTAAQVKDVLMQLTDAGRPRVCVTLADVTFLDSKAVGVIVEGTKRARERGGDLVIVCASERYARHLRILKLDEFLSIAASTDEALAMLSEAGEPHGPNG